MKFLEKVLAIMVLIGMLMKLVSMNGGMPLIALSLSGLSILYLVFGFFIFNDIRLRNSFKKSSYNGITAAQVIGSLLSAIVLSISIAGILFRQLYGDGNTMVLLTALGINVIFTITLAIIVSFRSKLFYKNILIRSAILLVIMCCLAIAPTKYMEWQKRKVITMETRLLENSQ